MSRADRTPDRSPGGRDDRGPVLPFFHARGFAPPRHFVVEETPVLWYHPVVTGRDKCMEKAGHVRDAVHTGTCGPDRNESRPGSLPEDGGRWFSQEEWNHGEER